MKAEVSYSHGAQGWLVNTVYWKEVRSWYMPWSSRIEPVREYVLETYEHKEFCSMMMDFVEYPRVRARVFSTRKEAEKFAVDNGFELVTVVNL